MHSRVEDFSILIFCEGRKLINFVTYVRIIMCECIQLSFMSYMCRRIEWTSGLLCLTRKYT